jgi:acetoacetyl-CoA synthetase
MTEILHAPRDLAGTGLGAFLTHVERTTGRRFADYDALWRWSATDLDGFWGAVWEFTAPITHAEPTAVLADREMPGARWFPGATLNFAENALRGPDEDTVVLARSQTRGPSSLTRGELRAAVARCAAGLRRLGVGVGDRVAAYLPNIPEAVVAQLATASLGAVWAACAPEFGTASVVDRFRQVEPVVLLAVDGYRHRGAPIDRRGAVADLRAALPTVRATVGLGYLDAGARLGDLSWAELLAEPAEPAYEPVSFDHPLWILFSSGTTGLPKAIVHGHGGIVAELAKTHRLQNDLGPGGRYFVHCTTSWVMWNIVVSALLVGATIVTFDGDPGHPDERTLWELVAEAGVTAFGCGAAFLMQCRKVGLRPGDEVDLSALRTIGSTGSPLPAEGFRWVYDAVSSDVALHSSSGGTDVCTGFVGGSPWLPVRAGVIAGRSLGVAVDSFDPAGRPVRGAPGELVVTAPMPSMPVSFWGDPDGSRYRDSYFAVYPGVWRHGDWIVLAEDGSSRITGRSDGTLNRGGVRLGSAEFYSALDDVPEVADSLVVHLEDPDGGAGRLVLFVVADLDEALRRTIRRTLKDRLSPRHVPDEIHALPAVPYNLTGKKLEVPVKRLLQGAPRAAVVSDGAVRDPSVLDAVEGLARSHFHLQ